MKSIINRRYRAGGDYAVGSTLQGPSAGGLENSLEGQGSSKINDFAREMASKGITDKSTILKMGKKAGFTLIELLVTVSIIGALVGVLLPALSAARGSAKNLKCMANLRTQGQALVAYTNDHSGYLPQAMDKDGMGNYMPSTNNLWGGLTYQSEGHLIEKGYIPEGSASVFWCPSGTQHFSENDPVTGEKNLGMNSKNSLSNYYFRGIPQDLKPRLANNRTTKALAADLYVKNIYGSIKNHNNHVNTLYTDGHVNSVKVPSEWEITQNAGGDSSPGANDGTWHQLDSGKTIPYSSP